MNLKILSWNIWYDNDFKQVCDFLAVNNADIIGLQEIVPNDPARDVGNFLKELGYHEIIVPTKTLSDGRLMSNAIFSKYPIINTKTHLLSTMESRTAVQANIAINGKVLHVFSTHLLHTHQTDGEIQLEQTDALLKSLPTENTIAMGDFNALPKSLVIQKINTVLSGNTEQIHTVDPALFDCTVCEPSTYSTLRLDYIFTTPDLKTSPLTIENSQGSDHLAISTIIEL